MIGEHWNDLGIEADPEYVYDEVLPTIEIEGQWTGTTRCVRSDGTTFLAQHSLTQNEGDELICVVRDVTERRRLEAELDEVLGRVTDAFYALDEEWQFTHVNERAEELIDYTGEGLLGESIWEVFEWGADSKLREEYERAMETQEATTFELYYPGPLDAWYEISAYPSDTGLSVYFRDVTERKERERFLQDLYETTASPDLAFEEKIERLLTLGREWFDLDIGYFVAADVEDDRFEVIEAVGTHDQIQPGVAGSLSGTYCEKVMESDQSVCVTDAVAEEWEDDPCYDTFGLKAYLGTPLEVNGELYGALCFGAETPREDPFTDVDYTFLELMSQWVSYELEQRQREEQLAALNEGAGS